MVKNPTYVIYPRPSRGNQLPRWFTKTPKTKAND